MLLSVGYSYIYISRDSGNTWNKYRTPSDRFDGYSNILLSPVNANLMFIKDHDGQVRKWLYFVIGCNVLCGHLVVHE